jgi:hypothetical protein
MKPKTIMLVVEFPGGKDGFKTVSQARDFLSSALHSEGELRIPGPNYEWPWNNDTDAWYARIKDFRKTLQGLSSSGQREKTLEEYALDVRKIADGLDLLADSMCRVLSNTTEEKEEEE